MAADKRAARLGVLALVALLLFSLVGARLWFLQTVEQESLQAEVNTTKLRTVPLLPERGRIFDADGRILADNDRVLTVGVDWELIRREDDRTQWSFSGAWKSGISSRSARTTAFRRPPSGSSAWQPATPC